jgi:DNA-binding NarL/FixJ family response regulator
MLNQQETPEPRYMRSSEAIEVYLVEDHGYFRQGLRELIEAHDSSIQVVGDSDSAEAALQAIPELQPDVVLMDLHLGEMSGTEAIRQLTTLCPLVRVLVLSGSAQDHDVLQAIVAGARGYLIKTAPVPEIVEGIRTAAQGGSVLSPVVSSQILDYVRDSNPQVQSDTPTRVPLTPRELEVLRLMAAGLENAQIAEKLVISPRTARNHVASILAKLQMENRIQAAVYAVKHGLA